MVKQLCLFLGGGDAAGPLKLGLRCVRNQVFNKVFLWKQTQWLIIVANYKPVSEL